MLRSALRARVGRATKHNRTAGLNLRAGKKELCAKLLQHVLHQVVLANGDAAREHEQVRSQALLHEVKQTLLLVGRDGQQKRLPACSQYLRRQRVTVGIADFVWAWSRRDFYYFVTRRKDGDAGPAPH